MAWVRRGRQLPLGQPAWEELRPLYKFPDLYIIDTGLGKRLAYHGTIDTCQFRSHPHVAPLSLLTRYLKPDCPSPGSEAAA